VTLEQIDDTNDHGRRMTAVSRTWLEVKRRHRLEWRRQAHNLGRNL